MPDLTSFTLRDMSDLVSTLRHFGSGARSMEEVSNGIVRYLYDNLADKHTGVRSCALVRLFKTHPYVGLDQELQKFTRQTLGNEMVLPDMKCLVLLATAGDKPEWNSRKLSVSHQAIPLQSPEMVERSPMIANLIKQFGLEIAQVLMPKREILVELEQRTYNVFYVPEALGSPYVYAQEEFVIPFGIKSVLGFGAMLPSGNLFAVILFSKVPIVRETADMFVPVALSVKLALLPFDDGNVFASEESLSGRGGG